ncbi:MAG: tyrosine-type recombinase/integrase [Acetobacteraceae bacterium]
MPRKARDERLDTRTARLKLKPRREPYWRNIQEGRALGYRRLAGGKGGTWIARHYARGEGRQYRALGDADDLLEADGSAILTFVQAQDRAVSWFAAIGRHGGKAPTSLTVKEAVAAYLVDYRTRGGKALSTTEATINAHILPALGDRKLADLTTAVIRRWHRDLATAPARLRTSAKAEKRRVRKTDDDDPDAGRARRATANRILTVLKAALNLAFVEGRVASDEAWRKVKPFKAADAPRVRYLTDDESVRLVNASQPGLRELVTAALLTGCRYGELTGLRAGDVNFDANVLTIGASKSGKARHVMLIPEAVRFFKQQSGGKSGRELLLTRTDGEPWGRAHQFRPLREACAAAKIEPAASFHVLRHTYASRLAMRGAPMAVIAEQLGHADLKMTARHYAHLSPGYVAEMVRQAFGSLGIVPESNVTPIRREGSR